MGFNEEMQICTSLGRCVSGYVTWLDSKLPQKYKMLQILQNDQIMHLLFEMSSKRCKNVQCYSYPLQNNSHKKARVLQHFYYIILVHQSIFQTHLSYTRSCAGSEHLGRKAGYTLYKWPVLCRSHTNTHRHSHHTPKGNLVTLIYFICMFLDLRKLEH